MEISNGELHLVSVLSTMINWKLKRLKKLANNTEGETVTIFMTLLPVSAQRLSNLTIGTTNVSPLLVEPNLTNFDVCATFDDIVPAGDTRAFECTTKGRYLIVQINGLECLTICEAKVYGGLYLTFAMHQANFRTGFKHRQNESESL